MSTLNKNNENKYIIYIILYYIICIYNILYIFVFTIVIKNTNMNKYVFLVNIKQNISVKEDCEYSQAWNKLTRKS